MFNDSRTLKNLLFGAALAILPLLAGCGGGGGGDAAPAEEDDSSGPGLVTCIILILATGESVCDKSASSSPTSVQPSSLATAPQLLSTATEPLLQENEEFEFNGDLGSANLPSYAARTSTDQEIGWFVTGSINDVSDITDTFAFTPLQTREYVLALCPPAGSACDSNNGIDTLTAFFRLLDQDGNVLLTSEADTVDGNNHRITLNAGVLYYLTVDAGDTMGVTVDYRAFVYEAS